MGPHDLGQEGRIRGRQAGEPGSTSEGTQPLRTNQHLRTKLHLRTKQESKELDDHCFELLLVRRLGLLQKAVSTTCYEDELCRDAGHSQLGCERL